MLPLTLALIVGYLFALLYPITLAGIVMLCCSIFVVTMGHNQVSYKPVTRVEFATNKQQMANHSAAILCWFVLFGVVMMNSTIGARLERQVSVTQSGQKVSLVGRVEGVPRENRYGWHTTFRSEQRTLFAYWPLDAEVQAGDLWAVDCILQPINAIWSPGAMDPAKSAFMKGVDGRCTIKSAVLLSSDRPTIVGLQAWVRNWVRSQPIDAPFKAYATALLLGDRTQLTVQQQQLMRDAHTSHLLVVSGLHLSLVFGVFYGVVGLIGRLLWLHAIRPIGDFQWVIGLLSALFYAVLCDFPLPTQRALLMLAVPAALHVTRRSVGWGNAYLLALCLVLVLDPFALLQFSAWLSFGAVGVLMLGMRGRRVGKDKAPLLLHWLALWTKPQWLVALGLAPILWLMGVPSNPASILVNIVAIPLVAFFLLPGLVAAITLGWFLPFGITNAFIAWLNKGFWLLERLMEWGGQFQMPVPPQGPAILLYGLWVLVLLTPSGLPGRLPAATFLFMAWMVRLLWLPVNHTPLELYVLDVGQGQAIVIHQSGHWILIDTGPGDIDRAGQLGRVVMPFIKQKGVRSFDAVVLSHQDTDHVGGLLLAPAWIESPLWLFGEAPYGTHACVAGQQWDLGPLSLKVLSPPAGTALEGNAASCVVQVASEDGCILLPGDIDKRTEYEVLAGLGVSESQPCSVLVGSHHGSASSTTHSWLATFSPNLMVFSAGRNNRFGHPSGVVIDKLDALNIPWVSTHTSGTLKVVQKKGELSVSAISKPFFYWQ